MIIKDKVDKEVALGTLLDAMVHYLTAIKRQAYLPVDERMKALDEVAKALPLCKRYLNYLKTKEINSK